MVPLEKQTFSLTADRTTWETLLALVRSGQYDHIFSAAVLDDALWRQIENKLKRTKG